MSELHGVRSAARVLKVSTTRVYCETARGNIRAKVDPTSGEMSWDGAELELFRANVLAAEQVRLAESVRQQAERFAAVNRKR